MKHTPLCLLILLFSTFTSSLKAQGVQAPKFPEPENTFYDLLEEEKVENPGALNGPVKEVVTSFLVYDEAGIVASSENTTTLLDTGKHLLKHYNVFNGENVDMALPVQETDSIDGHLRIIVENPEGDENEFVFNEYWYKNDRLVKQVMSEGGVYLEKDFSYGKHGRLVMIRTYEYDIAYDPDVEMEEPSMAARREIATELVKYDRQGRVKHKEKYAFWYEVVNVDKIEYQYRANDQCARYVYTHDRFIADQVEYLEKQRYKAANRVEGEAKKLVGEFNYDEQNRLSRFALTDTDRNFILEAYEISYQPNQMTIDVTFQDIADDTETKVESQAQYQYSFDAHHNPTRILSYGYEQGKRFLDKETKLKITYYE